MAAHHEVAALPLSSAPVGRGFDGVDAMAAHACKSNSSTQAARHAVTPYPYDVRNKEPCRIGSC
jgi:hypothetical protein